MIKPGYFRIEGKYQSLMSFADFMAMDESRRVEMWNREQKGEIQFYCACCDTERLQLHLTKGLILRVAHNGQQDKHYDSCPKSRVYEQRMREFYNGVDIRADEVDLTRGVYHLSLPPIMKPEKQEYMHTGKTRDVAARDKKIAIDLFVRSLIRRAWQKQQYSIKKKIRDALQNKEKPQWTYKNLDEFLRLFFGNCQNVIVQVEGEDHVFYDFCYKPSVFYKTSNDYRFFMCAKILKINEYNPERKYQYITVEMATNRSKNKATVRVPSSLYEKIEEELTTDIEGTEKLLCGWIYHAVFNSTNGPSDWISMLRGTVIYVTKNGMYADSAAEAELINNLCDRRFLFVRPDLPVVSYGGNMPTAIIEKRNGKDIIVDVVGSNRTYGERKKFVEDNEQYEVFLYKKGDVIDYDAIRTASYRKPASDSNS